MGNSNCNIDVEIVIERWMHNKPRKLLKQLIDKWSIPTGIGKYFMVWEIESREPYIKIEIRDEKINYCITTFEEQDLTLQKACNILKRYNKCIIDLYKKQISVRSETIEENERLCLIIKNYCQGKGSLDK